jgi:hypothetical protein
MSNDSFSFKGNISGGVFGGRHGKVVINNGNEPDGAELRKELKALRRRIEELDPATPGRGEALAGVARVKAAVERDGDGDEETAEASLSWIGTWSQGVGLALELTKLVDQVRAWFT